MEFDEIFACAINFAEDFGVNVAIGRNWPVHIGDGDACVRLAGATFGVEEVEVDYVAFFESGLDGGSFGCTRTAFNLIIIDIVADGERVFDFALATGLIGDIINCGNNIAICVNFEATLGIHVETTKVENELAIQKYPNVIITAEPELFSAVGGNFHGNAHVGGEMEIMAALAGIVLCGKSDIVEREFAFAAVRICVLAGAIESDFAIELFGKLFARSVGGFVEPAVEIISRLDRVSSGNIGSEDVVISVPGVASVGIGWNGEIIVSEAVFDHALNNAFSVQTTFGPLKLAVDGVAIVLALIPVGDGDGNLTGVAERSSLPDRGDTIFVGDGLERHSTNEGRDSDNG